MGGQDDSGQSVSGSYCVGLTCFVLSTALRIMKTDSEYHSRIAGGWTPNQLICKCYVHLQCLCLVVSVAVVDLLKIVGYWCHIYLYITIIIFVLKIYLLR